MRKKRKKILIIKSNPIQRAKISSCAVITLIRFGFLSVSVALRL
jgi:hypothetical protein